MYKRIQFSLRGLLAVTTLFGLWFGWAANRARHQREAVKEILAVGGTVSYDYEMDQSGSFTPNAEPPWPRWLRRIPDEEFYRDVVHVDVALSKIDDAWLVHLKHLPKIRRLSLCETAITDAGIESIDNLHELESVFLSDCRISDRSIAHLVRMNPGLRTLSMSGPDITDASLAHVAHLDQLRGLFLSGAAVTDDGLAQLSGLQQLEVLWLASLPISDQGVKKISDLPALKRLFLLDLKVTDASTTEVGKFALLQRLAITDAPITDAGVEPLARLKYLSRLELYKTRVTDRAVQQLGSSLPMCKVDRTPPP